MKNQAVALGAMITAFIVPLGHFLQQLVIEHRARRYGPDVFLDRSFRSARLSYFLPIWTLGFGIFLLLLTPRHPDGVFITRPIGIVALSGGLFLLSVVSG